MKMLWDEEAKSWHIDGHCICWINANGELQLEDHRRTFRFFEIDTEFAKLIWPIIKNYAESKSIELKKDTIVQYDEPEDPRTWRGESTSWVFPDGSCAYRESKVNWVAMPIRARGRYRDGFSTAQQAIDYLASNDLGPCSIPGYYEALSKRLEWEREQTTKNKEGELDKALLGTAVAWASTGINAEEFLAKVKAIFRKHGSC
jgi:hypothetical protein